MAFVAELIKHLRCVIEQDGQVEAVSDCG